MYVVHIYICRLYILKADLAAFYLEVVKNTAFGPKKVIAFRHSIKSIENKFSAKKSTAQVKRAHDTILDSFVRGFGHFCSVSKANACLFYSCENRKSASYCTSPFALARHFHQVMDRPITNVPAKLNNNSAFPSAVGSAESPFEVGSSQPIVIDGSQETVLQTVLPSDRTLSFSGMELSLNPQRHQGLNRDISLRLISALSAKVWCICILSECQSG